MKMVAGFIAWMVAAVAWSQEVNLSDGMWKLLQERVAAEVKKDYPDMKEPRSTQARRAAQLARDALDPQSPDHGAGLAYDAPRYFADKAARQLAMPVIHDGVIVEPAVAQRRKSSSPTGGAEKIGEAVAVDETGEFAIASREYPILTDRGSGSQAEVDPRFWFQAVSTRRDEGATWDLYITLSREGWDASPPVTAAEYLALVNQGLDCFRKDVPEAKVAEVSVDITRDSEILPDIVKALRPLFEEEKKHSLTEAPNEHMKGRAIDFPKQSTEAFFRAVQDSKASQRIGAEMARHLGREYLKVVGSNKFAFGKKGKEGEFWGKPWDELLNDQYLGVDPFTMRLIFMFGPQSEARQ